MHKVKDSLTDKQWREKYKGLTADKRSEVYERRKSAADFVDFPNPYRKEMLKAWQLPDGYGWDDGVEAVSDLEKFLPKAMTLYDKGETAKALGVSFDLLDMLMVMKSCDSRFFIDGNMETQCPWSLAEVTLYPICKIYNDKNTPQEVKSEIYSRIKGYSELCKFPERLSTGRAYEPKETFSKFGTFERELDFYDYFGLNPYGIHEEEKAEALSDEEYEAWQRKIYREVLEYSDYGKLSMEELASLSEILAQMNLYHADIEKVCSLDHYDSCLDGVKAELLARLGKCTDLAEQSMIFSSLCGMARVSEYEFTDDVIAREKEFIGSVRSAKDVDYHILHTALLLLSRVPLGGSKPDGQGNMSYTFTFGQGFYERTLRSWATSQNKDGSWTGVFAEEAYGRIFVIANDCGATKDIDNARITYLAYNHYGPTPCTTAKELYAKSMAYDSKYRSPYENAPAFIHRQAIAMLRQESLSLSDRLILYDMIL